MAETEGLHFNFLFELLDKYDFSHVSNIIDKQNQPVLSAGNLRFKRRREIDLNSNSTAGLPRDFGSISCHYFES